jgi:hypothetical protein
VARCLAKSPDDHYPSADELSAALRAAAGAAGPGTERQASAIHVAFSAPAEDDEALALQAEALGAGEEVLRVRGFGMPLVTASSILAVRVVSAGADAGVAAGREAMEVAALVRQAVRAASGDVADQLVVWVHVGAALLEGDEVVGGAVCRPEEWARPAPPGVHATPSVASLTP